MKYKIESILKSNVLNKSVKPYLLAIICLAFYGCGKEIQNTEADDNILDRPALGINVMNPYASIDASGSIMTDELQFQENAWLKVPQKLRIVNGTPSQVKAKLYFNVGHLYEEKYCIYKSVFDANIEHADKYFHSFLGCYKETKNDGIDNNDEELNYIPGHEIPQNRDYAIKIILDKTHTEQVPSKVTSDVLVEWL